MSVRIRQKVRNGPWRNWERTGLKHQGCRFDSCGIGWVALTSRRFAVEPAEYQVRVKKCNRIVG